MSKEKLFLTTTVVLVFLLIAENVYLCYNMILNRHIVSFQLYTKNWKRLGRTFTVFLNPAVVYLDKKVGIIKKYNVSSLFVKNTGNVPIVLSISCKNSGRAWENLKATVLCDFPIMPHEFKKCDLKIEMLGYAEEDTKVTVTFGAREV